MTEDTSLSPTQWLNELRKRSGYYSSTRFSKRDSWPDYVKHIRQTYPSLSSPETDFVNLTDYDVEDYRMQSIVREIGLENAQTKTGEPIFFGVFPTKEIRGVSSSTPRGDRVVLMHKGMMGTLRAICIAIPLIMNTKNLEGSYKSNAAILNFISYVGKYWDKTDELMSVVYEDWAITPRTEFSWRHYDLKFGSSMAFLLGHELSHAANYHAYDSKSKKHNHDIEFAADRHGLDLFAEYFVSKINEVDRRFWGSVALGPYIMLALTGLVSNIEDSDEHPALKRRLWRVNAGFLSAIKKKLSINKQSNFLDRATILNIRRSIQQGNEIVDWHIKFRPILKDMRDRAGRHLFSPVTIYGMYDLPVVSLLRDLYGDNFREEIFRTDPDYQKFVQEIAKLETLWRDSPGEGPTSVL